MTNLMPKDYAFLLTDIMQRISSAQYDALKAVNKELVSLYWDLVGTIVERHKGKTWGKSIVQSLAIDLHAHNTKLGPWVKEIGWFRTQMTRIRWIFTDLCASASSAQSVFHCTPSAFICVHPRLIYRTAPAEGL